MKDTTLFMDELNIILKEKAINNRLDTSALTLISNTYDTYIKATKILLKEGLIINTTTKAGDSIKAHPAVKIQLDAQVQLTKLLIEFGLTPKSRKDIVSQKDKYETMSPIEQFVKDKTKEVR